MDEWKEHQLDAFLNANNESELFRVLSSAVVQVGFDYYAYVMQMPLPMTRRKIFLRSNYPTAWQQRYEQENYLTIDPVLAHGVRCGFPIVWTDGLFDFCRPFWEDARSYGLCVGWSQSYHNAKGVGGLLSVARSHDPLSQRETASLDAKLSWLALITHEKMCRLKMAAYLPESDVVLTKRESEVLRWTADGKTASEAATIMCISARTVHFHVNNVILKLGAANKTAAAIKAVVLGLL